MKNSLFNFIFPFENQVNIINVATRYLHFFLLKSKVIELTIWQTIGKNCTKPSADLHFLLEIISYGIELIIQVGC